MTRMSPDCRTRAELLLFLEEPDSQTQQHVARCPLCTQVVAELRQADADVKEYRTLFAEMSPAVPPTGEAFRARLKAAASVTEIRPPVVTARRWRRAGWAVAAAAACVLIALQSRNVWNPASVEAAEILRNASVQPAHPRRFVIRQGGQAVSRVDQRRLQAARIEPQDPLNVGHFALWREEHNRKHDTITRGNGWVRLSTAVLGDAVVESASITLNSQNWAPVARSVHFRDEPEIEFTAVADEPAVRPSSPSVPPRVTEQFPAAGNPEIAVRSDDTAIRLWEVLHRTDADVLDSAELRLQSGRVCYDVWSEEGRREVLRRELANIPEAKECRPENSNKQTARVLDPISEGPPSTGAAYSALVRHFGDEQRADAGMNDVVQQFAGVLARVTALERYLRWFTPQVVQSMDSPHRGRVEAIARDHVDSIRSKSSTYMDAVSQLLGALGAPTESAPLKATGNRQAACGSSGEASSLASELLAFHRGYVGLFADPDFTAVDLERVVRARSKLARRLRDLCSPTP